MASELRRGSRLSGANGNSDFLSSLAAPKSAFFRHITVEPLAFLAIMALYLEFPAIQDLIYTKICLELAAGRQDLLRPATPGGNSTLPSGTAPTSLPAGGRIQQPPNASAPPTSSSLQTTDGRPIQLDLHAVCDRLNRSAVPLAIRQEIVDVNALFWLKYQILVCLLSALASPHWGGVSDRIGRLLPLCVPIAAAVLCNAISLAFGLLISLDWHALVHINWLLAGAALVGLSGGQSVLLMNAFSFIGDTTTSEERSKRVAVLEAVVFGAHSAGFLLSKLVMPLGLAGPRQAWLNRHFVSFAAAILLNLLCLLYALVRLRHRNLHKFLNNFERQQRETARLGGTDSLAASTSALAPPGGGGKRRAPDIDLASCGAPGERPRELTSNTPDDPDGPIARSDRSNWSAWDTLITWRHYRDTWELAARRRPARALLLLLLLLGFLSALSLATLMSLLFIYVKMDPFNWPTSQYSAWNANSSIARGLALVSLTLLMKFLPAWSPPDALVAALGFLGKGAGLLMLGLAPSTPLVNWSLVPFTLSEFSMPPIRSALSKLVPGEELCKLYSCLGALQSLCFILGNLAFYLAFTSFAQRDLFRLAFLTVGAVELAALLLVLLVHTKLKRQILVT